MPQNRTLGEAIRAARQARRWTQEDLAQQSGVSRPTVARLEAGRGVSTTTLTKLAEALNLRVQLLQYGEVAGLRPRHASGPAHGARVPPAPCAPFPAAAAAVGTTRGEGKS